MRRARGLLPLLLPVLLGACGTPQIAALFAAPGEPPATAAAPATAPAPAAPGAAEEAAAAVPPAAAPPPRPAARTVEEFDTTTPEQRAAAVSAPEPAGERRLGTTVASLGPPAEPGIWLRTPLVSEVTRGRVEYPVTGKSVVLELRPSGGVPGSGSQISLAAMRLLEVPLTALPELVVFR